MPYLEVLDGFRLKGGEEGRKTEKERERERERGAHSRANRNPYRMNNNLTPSHPPSLPPSLSLLDLSDSESVSSESSGVGKWEEGREGGRRRDTYTYPYLSHAYPPSSYFGGIVGGIGDSEYSDSVTSSVDVPPAGVRRRRGGR